MLLPRTLFNFLAANGALHLPGVGSFSLITEAAVSDVAEQQLQPPVNTVRFSGHADDAETAALAHYISHTHNINETEARNELESYSGNLLAVLEEEGRATLPLIGQLRRNAANACDFEPAVQPVFLQPVPAVRVIRKEEIHLVRVGEEEKTNVEMAGLLAETPARKSKWWLWPLIIGLLAVAYLAWHLVTQKTIGTTQPV